VTIPWRQVLKDKKMRTWRLRVKKSWGGKKRKGRLGGGMFPGTAAVPSEEIPEETVPKTWRRSHWTSSFARRYLKTPKVEKGNYGIG